MPLVLPGIRSRIFFNDSEQDKLNKWTVNFLGGASPIELEERKLVSHFPQTPGTLVANMNDLDNYIVQCRVDDIELLGGQDSELMILFRWTPGGAVGKRYGIGYMKEARRHVWILGT